MKQTATHEIEWNNQPEKSNRPIRWASSEEHKFKGAMKLLSVE